MKKQMVSGEEYLAELHGGTGSVFCLGTAEGVCQSFFFI